MEYKSVVLFSFLIFASTTPVRASEYLEDSFESLQIAKMHSEIARLTIHHEINSPSQILALFLTMSEEITRIWLTLNSHKLLEDSFEIESSEEKFLKHLNPTFEQCLEDSDIIKAHLSAVFSNSLKQMEEYKLSDRDLWEAKESKRKIGMYLLEKHKRWRLLVEERAQIIGSEAFQLAKNAALIHSVDTLSDFVSEAYFAYLKRINHDSYPFDSWGNWVEFRMKHFESLPYGSLRYLNPWLITVNMLMASKDRRYRRFVLAMNDPDSVIMEVPRDVRFLILTFFMNVLLNEVPPAVEKSTFICAIQ